MTFKTFDIFVNENINSLGYVSKRDHDSLEIPLDELPLKEPPKNNSEETKKELEYLSTLPKPTEFDKSVDEGFSKTFHDFIESRPHGNDVKHPTEKDIQIYSKRIKQIVIALKNHYDRPRPIQLAKYHGIDIGEVYPSKTSDSPSYPSGHTVQPFAIAEALSKENPDLRKELFQLADDIATSRLRMRIHYPSDYEYGKKLGKIIGKKLFLKREQPISVT